MGSLLTKETRMWKFVYDNPIKTVVFMWVLGGIAEDVTRAARGEPQGWVIVGGEKKKKTSKPKRTRRNENRKTR